MIFWLEKDKSKFKTFQDPNLRQHLIFQRYRGLLVYSLILYRISNMLHLPLTLSRRGVRSVQLIFEIKLLQCINLISCFFTFLNNNYEQLLFGKVSSETSTSPNVASRNALTAGLGIRPDPPTQSVIFHPKILLRYS